MSRAWWVWTGLLALAAGALVVVCSFTGQEGLVVLNGLFFVAACYMMGNAWRMQRGRS